MFDKKAYNKKYWKEHKEQLQEKKKKFYKEHKEKIQEYNKKYYENNKEHLAIKHKEYNAKKYYGNYINQDLPENYNSQEIVERW